MANVAAADVVNAGTTVGLTSGGTADAIAVVAGTTIANTHDFSGFTNFEKFTANGASATAFSLSLKADVDTELPAALTIDFSADTNAGGTNVIDLSLVDAAYTVTGSAGVDTITSSLGKDIITAGGGTDGIVLAAATATGVAGYGATTVTTTATLDIINLGALSDNDTINVTGITGTDANVDVKTVISNGGNLVGTVVTSGGAGGSGSVITGIYDATAQTFTSTNKALGTTNALLVGFADADGKTTATDSIVLVGAVGLTDTDIAITNGIIII
jgi:hypothetical protein